MGAAAFYDAMHRNLAAVYDACCQPETINLDGETDLFKKLKAAFKRAVKYMHQTGKFSAKDLANKEVQPLILETNKVIKEAVTKAIGTEVPEEMLRLLQNDVFVFSGMKTYTQLKEASLLLLNDDKQIKPFATFLQDVKAIDTKYNENYLRAEYQYAIGTAQSAAQWVEYEKDGDRYNLQIRTANDDKVRASHAALHNLTLPQNDPFWKKTWTPFDWGCRCRIIQVLKDKYEVSDKEEASKAADKAIPAMFRYNPAIDKVIFPKKHPYFPQHCNGEKLNLTGLIGFADWLLDAETDRCKAVKLVKNMLND